VHAAAYCHTRDATPRCQFGELTPLSCIACTTMCCSVHKRALTYKIIFSTFSNQQVLCIYICLISCTESETYAHVGLRDGGPVFRAPFCIKKYTLKLLCYVALTRLISMSYVKFVHREYSLSEVGVDWNGLSVCPLWMKRFSDLCLSVGY